jgi:hypothetical protein
MKMEPLPTKGTKASLAFLVVFVDFWAFFFYTNLKQDVRNFYRDISSKARNSLWEESA